MSKVNIKPLPDMLLIRVNNERKDQTKSGIIIAKQGEAWQEDNLIAEVVNISDSEKVFKVGDLILIRGYEGKWLNPELFDKDPEVEYLYRVIDCNNVLAKVEQHLEVLS